MKKEELDNSIDLKKLFNMNNILNTILSFAAYIVVLLSVIVLVYLSFIKNLSISTDIRTIGIFSLATILLSMFCWTTFYRKQYEKVMADDIAQQELNKYSIHCRYYMAIKDWDDTELQLAIDKFNEDYDAKWLRYVEHITGVPIESTDVLVYDSFHKPVLDDNGEQLIKHVIGIKDLPYKGFKHKILMWRIKNHKHPQSGYNTSMELMSLFSFQESNLNKRNLKGDKKYFRRNAISRFISMALVICTGASLVPTIISGNISEVLIRLMLALGSIFSAVFMGALNGVRGARIKLSVVEDTCFDLERWGHKKPILEPYTITETNDTVENVHKNDEHIDYDNIFTNNPQ